MLISFRFLSSNEPKPKTRREKCSSSLSSAIIFPCSSNREDGCRIDIAHSPITSQKQKKNVGWKITFSWYVLRFPHCVADIFPNPIVLVCLIFLYPFFLFANFITQDLSNVILPSWFSFLSFSWVTTKTLKCSLFDHILRRKTDDFSFLFGEAILMILFLNQRCLLLFSKLIIVRYKTENMRINKVNRCIHLGN